MYTWILVFFTVFLKNRNISSKIKRSKVTDYAALSNIGPMASLRAPIEDSAQSDLSLQWAHMPTCTFC